jgi:hypothetical protein
MAISEHARVLITVKASPEPSEKYGDTVCVAGIRLDGAKHEWIRLYPVPLRWMTSAQQFKKYDVIEVDLLAPTNDKRLESHRIVLDSVVPTGKPIKDEKARGAILEPLIGPTMCELRDGVVANRDATSLGLVRVRRVKKVSVERAKPWTPAQQAKIDAALQRESLFGEAAPAELKAPRFAAKYHYECESADCRGHEQGILDWELTALQLHLSRDDDTTAMEKIRAKFHDDLCAPSRRPHFFVGNIADPLKRRNFSVLGVYRPPIASDYGATLDIGI